MFEGFGSSDKGQHSYKDIYPIFCKIECRARKSEKLNIEPSYPKGQFLFETYSIGKTTPLTRTPLDFD